MDIICSVVAVSWDLELRDLMAMVMDLEDRRAVCAWSARWSRLSSGFGGVVGVLVLDLKIGSCWSPLRSWSHSAPLKSFNRFLTVCDHFLPGG